MISKKKYKVKTKKNVLIPTRDGTKLAADIYMPDSPEKFPVIIEYVPYRKDDLEVAYSVPRLEYFVERGYIGVLLDIRGTGSSEGLTNRMMRKQEWEDGYDAVEWIAKQDWCDGNVGMTGLSYPGYASYLVAARNPPHLKAVIPMYAGDDFVDDNFPGGNPRFGFRVMYNSMMTSLNASPPSMDSSGRWLEVWKEHLEDNVPWMIHFLEKQIDNEEHREGSVKYQYDNYKIPTFIIGGWHDLFKNAPLSIYSGLKPDVPKKLLMGPWMHIAPADAFPGPRIDHEYECLRWWDYWLKGINTGIMEEPPITIFVRKYNEPKSKRKIENGYWKTFTELPKNTIQEDHYYLNSDFSLNKKSNEENIGINYKYKPSVGLNSLGTLTALGHNIGLPLDQKEDEAYSLSFTSNKLEKDLNVFGFPKVSLAISSTAEVSSFIVRLCDVAPDNTVSLVSRGSLNATRRESKSKPTPLEKNKQYTITFDLNAIAYVFEKNHRKVNRI